MTKSTKTLLAPRERRRLEACERRYEILRRKLSRTGYLVPGTVMESRLTCGNPKCRCRKNRRHRHGPYYYWTTKIKGRTVSQLLTPDEARLYREWIAHRRDLDDTVRAMLDVSRDVATLVLGGKDPFVPGR
jgi:hypothetical protein